MEGSMTKHVVRNSRNRLDIQDNLYMIKQTG